MLESEKQWLAAVLQKDATIQTAISNLNASGAQIALVVNQNGFLEGTISDGDVRRGLMRGLNLTNSIHEIVHRNPLVVPAEMKRELVIQLMMANKVQQVPIVNQAGQLVGLHLWKEIVEPIKRTNIMVIMAGGLGTRLRPHTDSCPKPMLLVAGKPMLQHIIDRAKLEGFNRFVITVHYLGHIIEEFFKDGKNFGVQIDYLKEDKPKGTAGALSMLNPKPNLPFIVTNGDVMTDIRYGELLDFHNRQDACATMAVRLHEWQHPFGVVRMKGIDIIGFEEKPIVRSHINAGVYALSPDSLDCLTQGSHCDMPTLFDRLQTQKQRTVAYPMHEPWLDVGRPDDLRVANSNNS